MWVVFFILVYVSAVLLSGHGANLIAGYNTATKEEKYDEKMLGRVVGVGLLAIAFLLKNVYFLCGGAYGGKTTMAKLLEEKHGFIRYRQGDHSDEYVKLATKEYQPVMSVDRGADWHAFFSQPPRQYADWLQEELKEEAEFTIADLLNLPRDKKVIVDGIIPLDLLKEISDYDHVLGNENFHTGGFWDYPDETQK